MHRKLRSRVEVLPLEIVHRKTRSLVVAVLIESKRNSHPASIQGGPE